MAVIVNIVEDVFDLVNDVVDWVVDEIVQPVVSGIGDVINYALDNPIEAIAKIGLTVTGNAWAIPLVDGAKTLAEGGDLGDALKSAAISYVGGKVGNVAGKYVSNVASDFIGDSFGGQIVSAGITGGARSATTALVYGQDPLQAFATGGIQGALGATLGQIDNMMEGQFENLQDGVKDSIEAGVASALGDGNISADTVGNIVATYSGVGDFMTKFLKEETGLSKTAANVITTAVTNSVSTALAGNPNMSGDAFFATMSEAGATALKNVIDKPVNDAIDKVSGAYGDTEAAANALNNATTNAGAYADEYNRLQGELNAKIAEQDELKGAYDRALEIYNNNQTEANANAVNAAAEAFNEYATNLEADYNDNYKNQLTAAENNFNFWNNQIPGLESDYNDARDWMVTTSEDLADELKPVMDAADKAVALTLTNGMFDEDAYRELAGLEAGTDVYKHYLENQNLPTDREGALGALATLRGNVTDQVMALSGVDVYQLAPEQLEAFYKVIDKEVGSYKDIFSLDFEAVAQEAYDAAFDATVSGDIYPQRYDKKSGVTANDIATGDAYLHIDAEDNTYKWMTSEQIEDQTGEFIVSSEYNPNTNTLEPVFQKKTDVVPNSGGVTFADAYAEAERNGTGEATYGGVTFRFPNMPKGSDTLTGMVRAMRDEAANTGVIPASAATFMGIINEFTAEAGAAFDAVIGEPLYEATKNIYNAYIKDSTVEAAAQNTASIVLGASGEMLEAVSGLALIMGANPDNAVGRAAEKLIQLSGDVSTDEYRAAVEDIQNTISSAEGWRDKSKAIFGAFAEHPAQFLGEYVVKELIQEVPLLLISGGTANVVKRGLQEAGEDFARRYAARAAVGTDIALNMAEAYGATAASTYDEAYDIATKAGMSDEDAQNYAIELAQNTGVLATVMAGATAGIGGAALAKSIFKTPDQKAAYQSLLDKIQEGAEVTIKEGVTESIEEALPQLYSATMLSQIDPTYDVAGSVAASAILGKIAGAGVAGGIYTGNSVADAAYSLNNTVKSTVDNASSASSGMSALQDLGFDTVTAGNLMNNRFDADFTTTAEAEAAFKEANPEFDTADVNFDSYVNTNDADLAAEVASYVDPRYLDVDEVKAAAAAEGITLTDEQAAAYVGQKNESSAVDAIRTEYDPQFTTAEEARAKFAELGFNPTDAQVNEFVREGNEADTLGEIPAYVDPRQVTEEEARQFFADQGYTPTQDEINSYVGQGGADFEATTPNRVETYVDPRQVTAEEAKQFFEDLGYTPTDAQVEDFVAQVKESDQQVAIAQYVDPRQVTMDELQVIADEEGLTLTEALAAAYIGQSEAETFQQEQLDVARAVYDPLATTQEEATQFFADTGYNATTEEIAQFVASKTEEAQTSAIGAYVDPRQVTAEEAEEFLSSIGYQPTQEEIDQFVGQVNDANFEVARQAEIDEYVDPRLFDAGEVRAAYEELGLVDVTQEDVDRFVGQYDPTSEDYSGEGFETYQRTQLEEYMPAATFNVIKSVLGSPAIKDNPDTPENEAKDATGIYAEFEAGATRDEALQSAIDQLKTDLGLSETEVLQQLGITKDELSGEIDAVAADVATVKGEVTGLGEQITGLGEQITGVEETLGADIDAIADIIGKPAQEVTQVDVDFVADVIAQSQVLDEIQTAQYDVTGDGIVDINDQNLLSSALQGEDVTFADTSMFGPATGIYGTIADVQSDIDTQTDTVTDILTQMQTQIQTGQDEQKAANLLQMLNQPGMLSRDVSVKMPDPLQLRYTYDISGPSIFATPGQAQLFTSPFGGTRATPANMTAVPQALGPSTAMTGMMPMMPRAAGFAEGGVVDETDALLALLGDID